MKLGEFIEAEKIAGQNVTKTCELFEVSRSAYYQRRNGASCARSVTDAELTEKIRVVASSSSVFVTARASDELLDFAASGLLSDPTAALQSQALLVRRQSDSLSSIVATS